MTAILQYVILSMTTMSAVAFGVYLVAMHRLPVKARPKVPVLDRFGIEIGTFENPGFSETEDEHE